MALWVGRRLGRGHAGHRWSGARPSSRRWPLGSVQAAQPAPHGAARRRFGDSPDRRLRPGTPPRASCRAAGGARGAAGAITCHGRCRGLRRYLGRRPGAARLGAGRPPRRRVELGANDGLRGLAAAESSANLAAILDRLAARHIPVLLAGMLAPPNLGPDYGRRSPRCSPAGARSGRVWSSIRSSSTAWRRSGAEPARRAASQRRRHCADRATHPADCRGLAR